MISPASGTKVHLAVGATNMRKAIDEYKSGSLFVVGRRLKHLFDMKFDKVRHNFQHAFVQVLLLTADTRKTPIKKHISGAENSPRYVLRH